MCVVPASVKRLRRDTVIHCELDEPGAVSPITMTTCKARRSQEVGLILEIVKQVRVKLGITFGA